MKEYEDRLDSVLERRRPRPSWRSQQKRTPSTHYELNGEECCLEKILLKKTWWNSWKQQLSGSKLLPLCEKWAGGPVGSSVLATVGQSWAAQVKGLLPTREVDWVEPCEHLPASLWGTHEWVLRAVTSSEEGDLIARSSVLPWYAAEWARNKWRLSLNHAAPYLIWKHEGKLIATLCKSSLCIL